MSAVCGYAGPQEAGNHTAAARPAGRGELHRAPPLGQELHLHPHSPWQTGNFGTVKKGDVFLAWLWCRVWRNSQAALAWDPEWLVLLGL